MAEPKSGLGRPWLWSPAAGSKPGQPTSPRASNPGPWTQGWYPQPEDPEAPRVGAGQDGVPPGRSLTWTWYWEVSCMMTLELEYFFLCSEWGHASHSPTPEGRPQGPWSM